MTLNLCPLDQLSFLTLPPSSGRRLLGRTAGAWRTAVKRRLRTDSTFQSWYRTLLCETAPWVLYDCSRITLFLLRLMNCPTFVNPPNASIIHAHLLRVEPPDLLVRIRFELIRFLCLVFLMGEWDHVVSWCLFNPTPGLQRASFASQKPRFLRVHGPN